MNYISRIAELISTDYFVQSILAIIAIAEFCITIISYIKISKVRNAQIDYSNIVELDGILQNLSDNTALLYNIKKNAGNTISQELSERIDHVVALNHECIGSVNKANQLLLLKDRVSISNEISFHAQGYFNNEFYREKILCAKKRIVLYIKRNARPFNLDNLSALIELCDNKDVNVNMFAFSAKMDNTLILEMMKSIPQCPDIKELKESQEAAKKLYISVKNQMSKPQNIHYYEYTSFPLSQYIIVDDKLYWGIVNYDKTSMSNVFENRPYVEMSTSEPFAEYIISLQDSLMKSCVNNGNYY